MTYHDIRDPFREKGMKNPCVGLGCESGSGGGGQDVGKAERWTKPCSLNWRTPSEYCRVRRWIEWRVEHTLLDSVARDHCFQLGSEIRVDIVPETTYRPVHRS